MCATKYSGTVRDDLKEVCDRFSKLLSKEGEGLALAVYDSDELTVNLWGGFADRKTGRLWTEDTLTIAFSTSKVIGALVIAILVTRGHLKYEDLVTKYWPEYGQKGKESTTVEWVVAHKSGLISFDEDLTLAQCNDHECVSKAIEKTRPRWTPGTVTAYHALTYGFLLDQLVRRADPTRRGVAEFFRQEIVPLMKDKDFYIGLPQGLRSRMAKLRSQSQLALLKLVFTDKIYMQAVWNSVRSGLLCCNCPVRAAATYPSCLNITKLKAYNKPEIWDVENLSALGIGTARGLASAISAILQNKLISEEVWDTLKRPTEYVKDEVIQLRFYRGHGFFYTPHPIRKDEFLLEHIGFGMQKVVFDPKTKVSLALLRNGLSLDYRKDKATDRIMKVVLRRKENS